MSYQKDRSIYKEPYIEIHAARKLQLRGVDYKGNINRKETDYIMQNYG
jgi:hypothetical protein